MSRYLNSEHTNGLESGLITVPKGFCNWCGKPVPRKNQRFCPGVPTGRSYRRWDKKGKPHEIPERRYDCYNKMFHYWVTIPRFKRVVFVRDNFTCQACGASPKWKNKFEITFPDVGQLACDHIHPYSKGGKTELSNLQTLCRKCNGKKRDKIDWVPQPELIEEKYCEIAVNRLSQSVMRLEV